VGQREGNGAVGKWDSARVMGQGEVGQREGNGAVGKWDRARVMGQWESGTVAAGKRNGAGGGGVLQQQGIGKWFQKSMGSEHGTV
jgi:hypothetical protein